MINDKVENRNVSRLIRPRILILINMYIEIKIPIICFKG